MLSVEAAREAILARLPGPLGGERVALTSAVGRVLAEAVTSERAVPPWPNSSMDGYAVRAVDVVTVPVRLTVVASVAAGQVPSRAVRSGEAVRIFTGAPLPEGADAVVPQEETEAVSSATSRAVSSAASRAEGDTVVVRASAGVGQYVRPRGEDLAEGELVLIPGVELGPAEVGLLATLGLPQVLVYRRPRVAILSTGNELADLGTDPGPGQIANSNSYSLMAQVLEAGGEPVVLGVARDDLDAIATRLEDARGADVLVTSAGVSVGDHDLVRDALVRSGAELHLWRVSMRPGKPITFGTLGHRLVFGLPGNPVSAMVTFELFVRPALRRLAGHTTLDRARIPALAGARIDNPGRRRGYLRVRLSRRGAEFHATLTGDQGSAILTSMARADGLAVVPGDTTIAPGDPVEVLLLRRLESLTVEPERPGSS